MAWIEGVGVFVVEVKSHTIRGIRRFDNNVPVVVYRGHQEADVNLLDQPRRFAYALKDVLERACDEAGIVPPPLYFAGWLPNVSPEDVASVSATVNPDKVWLSDMLEGTTFLARLACMKNLTRGSSAERSSLKCFCSVFGTRMPPGPIVYPGPKPFPTLGHLIDRKNRQLKIMTKEQEQLAFNPNLLRGPKVIRGVAGSGKTVVLAMPWPRPTSPR